jgi:hypothetical protein
VRRAERAGQSLQQYLAALAATPNLDEVLERVEALGCRLLTADARLANAAANNCAVELI